MSNISIESFADPGISWKAMNDPVMGGKSHSKVTIENGVGVFDGGVVDVPFLHAPGFITMRGTGGDFPDVSSCDSLQLRARASEPYSGYRISFGDKRVPGNRFARGYKADFDAPVGSEMGTVVIPFHEFTVRWDDATGDPVVTCHEDKNFCPDTKTLQNMKTMSLWGEGVAGRVHLEIESIEATGCSPQPVLRIANTAKVDSKESTLTMPLLVLAVAAVAFVVALIHGNRSRKDYEDLNENNRDSSIV